MPNRLSKRSEIQRTRVAEHEDNSYRDPDDCNPEKHESTSSPSGPQSEYPRRDEKTEYTKSDIEVAVAECSKHIDDCDDATHDEEDCHDLQSNR